MKRILLASASIVAFAGAAAAEVSFGGSATLGYNDVEEDGFFVESALNVTFAQELNNGLRAGVSFSLDIEDDTEDDFVNNDFGINDDFVVFLESDQGALRFGDTEYAAERHWGNNNFAGAVASDDFSEQGDETVIRADTTFGDVGASVSYNVADADGDSADDVDQLSLGASGSVSTFNFAVAYQEESDAINRAPLGDLNGDGDEDDEDVMVDVDGDGDLEAVDEGEEDTSGLFAGEYNSDDDDDFNTDEVFGLAAGTSFAGADVTLVYANNLTEEASSIGVSALYPFGPVVVGGFYTLEMNNAEDDPATVGVDESADFEDSFGVSALYENGPFEVFASYISEQGDDGYAIDALYDTGTGLAINAGIFEDEDDTATGGDDDDELYVAAIYDLGGPEGQETTATLSYSESTDGGLDDQYKEGTTASITFRF